MTLWQNGIKNVVSITLGAGYFSKEWVEQFSGIKKIFLAYDNDEAGREGAAKAAEMLGKDRCKIIELPNIAGEKKTDINEFFVKHKKSKEDFLSLVRKAVSPVAFDSESIKHISDFNDELRKRILE